MEFYHLAANQGNAFSSMAIGECYEDGVGVEKSLETAFDYFKKAADIALKKGLVPRYISLQNAMRSELE